MLFTGRYFYRIGAVLPEVKLTLPIARSRYRYSNLNTFDPGNEPIYTKRMKQELWTKVLDFDLDFPHSAYGFSTRLAHENYWTITFTQKAILEYKKFMFLAATSNQMVSPSVIVDTVWHQHLIFTESYADLCKLLGKKIEHIPSTHNHAEAEQFKNAAARTKELYAEAFGVMPAAFWQYETMYGQLALPEAKMDMSKYLLLGIIIVLLLATCFYGTLAKWYTQIGNPDFLLGYLGFLVPGMLILTVLNRSKQKQLVAALDHDAFVYELIPAELIYLRWGKAANIVHLLTNDMYRKQKIRISSEQVRLIAINQPVSHVREYLYRDLLENNDNKMFYWKIVEHLSDLKPFSNIVQFGTLLRKNYMNSLLFLRMFLVNVVVLGSIFSYGCIRLLTGISRHKPIGLLVFFLLVSAAMIVLFLVRMSNDLTRRTIPGLYRKRVEELDKSYPANEWNFFLGGKIALTTGMITLIANSSAPGEMNQGSSGGSGCGSSCGSSCGGGCGGCGG